MNKTKKIIALIFAFAFCITATFGATVAYLTDTDDEANTFAIGNVEIELIEQQRVEDDNGNKTTALEEFADDKVLLPIVGSAQNGEDAIGMPTAANYVDKIITVENTGSQDAWVRVIMAFPADMDAEKASEMMMHWNIADLPEVEYNWEITEGEKGVVIEGKEYNLYTFVHNDILTAGRTTESPAIIGVYIDSRVDATVDEAGNVTYSMKDANGAVIASATFEADEEGNVAGPQILVFAQAVQSAGFETAADAFAAAVMPANPWAE